MNILGISALYHDSAAALVTDGRIVAAAQEERFTRRKHDSALPIRSIAYCLEAGDVKPGSLDLVVFYEKPLTKLFRLIDTHMSIAPRSLSAFLRGMPAALKYKVWVGYAIEKALRELGHTSSVRIAYAEHHESHAASAFYPSPFERAAVLTMDGVGEWATVTIGRGHGNRLELLEDIRFPHSLGMLYSAFTYFAGFRVNSGEYKLMGLAPYGAPEYVDAIKKHLVHIREDGSFWVDQSYFDYLGGLVMTNRKFERLFGGPPRKPEAEITRREMDLARSIQEVTEEIVLRLAERAQRRTGERNLCLAGGVALNCVANGRLLRSGIFDDLWVQPAAGDAGGAIGAALHAWYQVQGRPRETNGAGDRMQGTYLGPSYSDEQVRAFLDKGGHSYERLSDDAWAPTIARLLAGQKVVGMFQGRMEFGPRALGNRSILGDPRSGEMQTLLNRKIKYRESFRPFAPAIAEENLGEYFELDRPSPYMLLVAPVCERMRVAGANGDGGTLVERARHVRSAIPAVTHVDYTARVQSVRRDVAPRFHSLLTEFGAQTGVPVLINTSFNVRGEPLVCSPEDAYRCFMRTEMDYLVLESCLLEKKAQLAWTEKKESWKTEFVLD